MAERKRRRRARTDATRQKTLLERASPGAPKPPVVRRAGRGRRSGVRETGLGWLLAKGRISPRQVRAGETFGALFRAAIIGGEDSLRSCLNISVSGGGSSAGGASPDAWSTAQWIAECRERLRRACDRLPHEGMVMACELICGHGLRPREITPVQRDAEQIETALRMALDVLDKHFAETGTSV